MALVALLRGVNVGGHRSLPPAALARGLGPLDVVNIGAAGTFVVRGPTTRAALTAAITRRVPFPVDVLACDGRAFLAFVDSDPFRGVSVQGDDIRFVTMLARTPRRAPSTPFSLPPEGPWTLDVLGRDGRFVYGVHQRAMRAIDGLRRLDELFGARGTTRGWATMEKVAACLRAGTPRPS